MQWQQPNNTEGNAWERLKACSGCGAAEYVPFPWASWIDAVHRGLRDALPPVQATTDQLRATVCQHIWAEQHLPVFRTAGITDLFWSHAPRDRRHHGVLRLHPFPLWPVRCVDLPPGPPPLTPSQRPLLYSYMGFHQPLLYPRATRRWLLSLPARTDTLMVERQEWHFEQQVYHQQLHGLQPDPRRLEALNQEAGDYVAALQQSCFALCPSGAGPNSIRLWEALGFGAIPVILSDALRLPGPAALWRQAALFVPEQEQAVAALPKHLEALRREPERLLQMQQAGRELWQRYGLPGFVSDVVAYLSDPDAFLLDQARRHLQRRQPRGAVCGSRDQVHLLRLEEPTELPLLVRRWWRSPQRTSWLLVQLIDERPLPMQVLRWRGAVALCRELLEQDPSIAWTVSSRSPLLEQEAEAAPTAGSGDGNADIT